MRKFLVSVLLSLVLLPLSAQVPKASEFKVVCDTLTQRCNRRFTVRSSVRLEKVLVRDGVLDLYFHRNLVDYPWHEVDLAWFTDQVKKEGSKALHGYNIGSLRSGGLKLDELITPRLGNNGKAVSFKYAEKPAAQEPFVRRANARKISRGLRGRHIALWQSHGIYYNADQDIWRWQRAPLHRTVEDQYTQSYVLPYLIPMLENAGAYVMTPRERDVQPREVVCDNDPSFVRSASPTVRTAGKYTEKGSWKTASGSGFADFKEVYDIVDNPFRAGTARVAECSVTPASIARWTPDIPARGEYAVYVSYASLRNSSSSARYTVRHLGGETAFLVDQRKAGGTWVYLGTFEFAPGSTGYVELDNKGSKGQVVSADAVRFGGGMGKIQRGGKLSGLPSFCEGASYWMPWAGCDSTMREWDGDYANDYAMRGAWTKMMRKDKGVPFDCSLAFHTDAGTTPNDSIVGTLAIYTLKCDGSREYSDGGDRMTGRTLTDLVQTQIVDDIRSEFEPKWSRRQLWDRSYSESRTTDVPGMLLELLSHQNLADMKYGLDPSFRFTVSRAIYKGMLKYLACRYGTAYTVQPLPVHAFSAVLEGDRDVRLNWQAGNDPLEPTATPKGYTVYTRIDDGAFDEGVTVNTCQASMQIEPGHVYSYKVVAWNDGGDSFPSEILSVGVPTQKKGAAVLIVNNFDRVAAPAWVDTPGYAGFDARLDPGMPDRRDILYIGENYEFRRNLPWVSDDNPGFGGSYIDKAGMLVAGNSFDYPSVHGRSLLKLGCPFCSMSSESFCADSTLAFSYGALDLVCGAQLTTKNGRGAFPDRYQVFPQALQRALRIWSASGRGILVSGSRIATDLWCPVYDITPDPETLAADRRFVQEVLGYSWASSFGTETGIIAGMPFYNELNEDCYAVPHPDGLKNADSRGSVWLRYGGSRVPAAVKYDAGNYKVVSVGVPIECLKRPEDRDKVIRESLEYLQ